MTDPMTAGEGRPPATAGRPPFRADHIGSLLRPKRLRDAFKQRSATAISDSEFRRVQDEAVRGVVKLQENAGLEVVTDGEFRRTSYWARFVLLTQGLTVKQAMFKFHDEHGHETDFTAPYVTGKVSRTSPITLDEYRFVASVAKATPKITMPSPSTMHFYRCNDYGDPAAYADARAFFSDLGKVYQQEIAELAKAGCRYVQLDEVALAVLCDPAARDKVRAAGQDPGALVDLYVDAINEAVKSRPPGTVIGVHMCRGNYKGKYLSEGGYDSIAEKLFQRADVNHFLLEFDTPRAGDFAPLRLMPRTKGVVLGMVSSKVPRLESLDVLRRRADEAAKYVDPSRLAISPQCGFASTIGGNPVTEDDERAKLKLCVDAARAIWG
ncbi:MAG: 5-methyltetrahydropteroyltriglutamate--homocysteine S-methyltransferase [Betaproteobacteria bacterium]|nr:5-methyltetrahydropteroyltriglutamate--homocysteine S-methyltransferase [Betaproteobacteria bacterium]